MRSKALIAVVAATLALGACQARPRHHLQREAHSVYHLKDGRYAYQDDSSVWWFYVLTADSGATNFTRTATGYSLPAGGSWSQGAAPAAEELQGAQQAEVEVVETATGDPATDAEVADSMGDGGAIAGESEGMGDGGATSGDSGGGDSGGGGDGGGGGGGDGGGSGE